MQPPDKASSSLANHPLSSSHSCIRSPPTTVPVNVDDVNGYIPPTFPIGPFQKHRGNPIIVPSADHDWASAFVYNPAAIVFNERIWLLYRAQSRDLISSIGLAWSNDGLNFVTLCEPVLSPTEAYENGGGCEDPRIIFKDDTFYMTYTAYDGITPRLALATSNDLLNWKKHGPLFETCKDAEYAEGGRLIVRPEVSKAGAMFTDRHPRTGKFIMIWGEGHMQLAESDDMINWEARDFNQYFTRGVHSWESRLVEPGPPPIKTKDGKHILIYNCSTLGGGNYAYNQYSVSQMLINLETIDNGPVARLEQPCLEVTESKEKEGQVGNVVFCEGIVQHMGKWWMYYGMGDAGIGVAICKAE